MAFGVLLFFSLIYIIYSLNLSRSEDAFAKLGNIDFKTQRLKMVCAQLEARGLKDAAVLEAMRKVERHRFVPRNLENFAYLDMPLPIGKGQTISQPYIVALMTHLLKLKKTDKVLEIGTGSGYQTAVMAEISGEVYSIEIIPELAKKAESLLSELGYENIRVKNDDGFLGWPEAAPFNAIAVTCAVKDIPKELVKQLAEGGRMVVPVGDAFQELKLLIKKNNKIEQKAIVPVKFVPLKRKE